MGQAVIKGCFGLRPWFSWHVSVSTLGKLAYSYLPVDKPLFTINPDGICRTPARAEQ